MPRHFFKLWNQPKSYSDNINPRLEKKIESFIKSTIRSILNHRPF